MGVYVYIAFPENELASIIHWNLNIRIDFIVFSFKVDCCCEFDWNYAADTLNDTFM